MKSLKQRYSEMEELTRKTGHYAGLNHLELYEMNPFSWEQAAAKLVGATVTAREVCVNIAASPITRSIGESCFVLFTPEGHAVALSTGIIVHVRTMSETIRHMIQNGYEEHPGIHEGDIFCNNDPALGNVHTADVLTIIPIFYKKKLIGWAGGVTHQVDIGAITPGVDVVTTTSRFEDGLSMTAEKIAENNRLLPHYEHRSRTGVRTPLYYDLDEKARIAGIDMIRRSVIDFVDHYGLDYYEKISREIIELSRRNFIARVKERTVPGRYRSVAFTETPFATEAWQSKARQDILHHLPLEMWVRPDGHLKIDYQGNSGYGTFPWNSSVGALTGTLWVILTQLLGYGEYINEGYNLALDIHRPSNTWMDNDHITSLSRMCPWWLTAPVHVGLFRNLQRSFFARGMIEESCAGYNWLGDGSQGGATVSDRGGELEGMYGSIGTFELGSAGFGGNPVRDGLDHGYGYFNPEADMGDVEDWERKQLGLRYLSRQVKANTAGYGRRRGGTGFESIFVFYGVKEAEVTSKLPGYVINNSGLAGGYPNAAGYAMMAHRTNIEELWKAEKPYPQGDNPDEPETETLLEAEVERLMYGTHYPRAFEDGDIFYKKYSGGPGYGDPLEREFERCEADLNEGIYTERIMNQVYGVVASKDGDERYTVNREASAKRREELRRQRRELSLDFADFYLGERSKIVHGDMSGTVKKMYKELIQVGPVWWKEFLDLWQLDAKTCEEGLH